MLSSCLCEFDATANDNIFLWLTSGKTTGSRLSLPDEVARELGAKRQAAVEEVSPFYEKLKEYADALHPVLHHDLILRDGVESLSCHHVDDPRKRKKYRTIVGEYILARFAIAARILIGVEFKGITLKSAKSKDLEGAVLLRHAAVEIATCATAITNSHLPNAVVSRRRLECRDDDTVKLHGLWCTLMCLADAMEGGDSSAEAQLKRWYRVVDDGNARGLEVECSVVMNRFRILVLAGLAPRLGKIATDLSQADAVTVSERHTIRHCVEVATSIYGVLGCKEEAVMLVKECEAHLPVGAYDHEEFAPNVEEKEMTRLLERMIASYAKPQIDAAETLPYPQCPTVNVGGSRIDLVLTAPEILEAEPGEVEEISSYEKEEREEEFPRSAGFKEVYATIGDAFGTMLRFLGRKVDGTAPSLPPTPTPSTSPSTSPPVFDEEAANVEAHSYVVNEDTFL